MKELREDKFFFKNQAMQEVGLHPIDVFSTDSTRQAVALCANFFDTCLTENEDAPINRSYYTFGWSGIVTPSGADKASEELYDALSTEIQKLPHNPLRKITIIGFSRGGTVALQLGKIYQKKCAPKPFTIDSLILIGTPMHKNAHKMMECDLFKKVYLIYSKSDVVQVIDIFAHKAPQLAYRSLPSYTVQQLPKFTQIEIKVFNCSTGSRRPRYRSPGHTQLWSFGWPALYQEFPLHPLPIVIFIPRILALVRESELSSRNIIMRLQANTGDAFLQEVGGCKKKYHFFCHQKLQEWKKRAHACEPCGYNKDAFNRHIKKAWCRAHELQFPKIRSPRTGRPILRKKHAPYC